MFNSDSDSEWEKFGHSNPYYGVLSDDKFLESNLTDENREDFFNSGSIYIDAVLKKIRHYIDPNYRIRKALDFGCGVGRLVIPLTQLAGNVTGIGVSGSMLEEARKNCDERSIKNVTLVKSDDQLSLLDDQYDFIHSFIVFQHIPVKRGEYIVENLIARLQQGGVAVLHFTYAKNLKFGKLVPFIKNYIPLAKNLINLSKGASFFAPQMQMNTYDLNRLFFILQQAGVSECCTEYTNHGGELGIVVSFRKPEKS